jgi:DNA-binding MarR family transcriptional regulator
MKKHHLLKYKQAGVSSLSQVITLESLLDAPESMTVTRIAASAECSAASATMMCDRLEDKGLVESSRNHKDRRIRMVWITPAGRNLVKAVQDERS